jgi:hypothetical protein
MFVHKLQTVLLTLGLVGAGAGAWLQPASENPPPLAAGVQVAAADSPKEPPNPAMSKDRDVPRPGERARQLRRQLSQYVTLEAIDPHTPLGDAVKHISEKFRIPIGIDKKAFEAVGVQKVEETPVELPKMNNVRLCVVLGRLMSQIKGDQYTGAYLIRPDRVELTSTYHQWLEAGADQRFPVDAPAVDDAPITPRELGYFGTFRRMTTVVHIDCERQTLVEALRELAEDTGYDIVIDPRTAEKAKAPITLALNNVWLDNAVSLMTEMAELDWYWMDRVVYVTSRESAKQHKEKLKTNNDDRSRPVQAAVNGLINVNCKDQSLSEVLRGLAGVQTVVDARVAEKAKATVTAKLDQVPPATAVRILADMADLGAVNLDGVFYVTSKDNARAMKPQ